ncbi:GNAT family N-acetyltransferase [Aspergillus mulundensis]|uniref:N-acetyltransferase domain-containing protein n=1 Tax=Aspergillus mulundensis TaxID=1810919 RepID=A0A3D8R4E5_9EURO|nr:Uncharacterized protein DSM5745_08617 [Aspergillus mulundensis]RDW68857.1 Uncharacterized protein DSM5745_08617 [Aspergillus mulundensis]
MSPFQPFSIATPRLILIPTPIAINQFPYRALYASLHANTDFCTMGFGAHFPARNWSDEETRAIIAREIARNWEPYGFGDFAVGLLPGTREMSTRGNDFVVLHGNNTLTPAELENIKWIGYAGIRDATTTSLPPREEGDEPFLPWQVMVEVRYGISPEFWGRGLAKEAAEAVISWAIGERGVRRFIAETEKGNSRSGKVLRELGFRLSGTDYWKEESQAEWEFVVPVEDGQRDMSS